MHAVAIIPARGGSKRIPGKNIKPFAGQPIIAYSLQAAKATGLFDNIIVSTDSEEIAQVAREFGAEVPFMRPRDLADDHTGTDKVIIHALHWLMDHGHSVRFVCCIYPTAPLLRAEFIRKGYNLLVENEGTSAFSVTTFPYPIFRALKINEAGMLGMIWPEHLKTRSQDLLEAYHDAGQFYWAKVKQYLLEQSFFSNKAIPVILPRYLVQDIDSVEDWETAELLFEVLRSTKTEGVTAV